MGLEELKNDEMMSHLIESLESGRDIGHYGRLAFVLVARHYLTEGELIEYLTRDPDCDQNKARALVQQVQSRDYNPPKRERVLEWDRKQEFPICPSPDDPGACNVYRNLEFPDHVYNDIQRFNEQATSAEKSTGGTGGRGYSIPSSRA